MQFNCISCGKLDFVLFNGYSVGDRLLEDVMFRVRVDDQRKYSVDVSLGSRAYFAQFNEQVWLDKVLSYVTNRSDFLACPTCNDDVSVDPWNEEIVDGVLHYDGEPAQGMM